MRKPVIPSRQVDTSRLVSILRDILLWIDAGTRTQDVQDTTAIIADDDLVEFVRPDGTRYAVTALDLKAYVNAP